MTLFRVVFEGALELFNINFTIYGYTFSMWQVFLMSLLISCVIGGIAHFLS